jgi:ketosteroid isomerase-like protein
MAPFTQILKRAEVLAAFGDDEIAVIVYDTETVPVPSAPAAECVTVRDGKITYSRFIFDRAPFDAARAAAP